MKIRIHPSILSADFVNMERDLGLIATADAVHVDVMDNHFVDNLTFGPQMVGRIQDTSPVPLDVHLMIDDPDRHAARYAELGVQSVTFHVEAARSPQTIIENLQSAGTQAAFAVRPATPIEPYLELCHLVDMVLVMTVEPGHGGQEFMSDQLDKLETLRGYLEAHRLTPRVQVDGGITPQTLPLAHSRGADTFVAGSSVFGDGHPADNIQALRQAAHAAPGKEP